jgi:hypothetical protein
MLPNILPFMTSNPFPHTPFDSFLFQSLVKGIFYVLMSHIIFSMFQPFKFLLLGLKLIFTEMIIELARIGMWVQSAVIKPLDFDYGDLEYPDNDGLDKSAYQYEDFGKTQKTTPAPSPAQRTKNMGKGKSAEALEAEEYFRAKQEKLAAQVITVFYACDREADLYVINEAWVKKNGSFSLNNPRDDARYAIN